MSKWKKLYNQIRLLCLVLQGFKYQSSKQYLRYERGHQNPQQFKRLMRLLPFNSGYEKILNDILSVKMVLQERSDCFATPYALVVETDRQKKVCLLPDFPDEVTQNTETLIALLRNKGALLVRDCKNMYPLRLQVWRYEAGSYYIDGTEISEQDIKHLAEDLPSDTLVCEFTEPAADYGFTCPMLHITMVKSEDGTFSETAAYVTDGHCMDASQGQIPPVNDSRVDAARAFAGYVSRKFRELPYLHLTMMLTQNGFVLMQFDCGQDLVHIPCLPDEVEQLLARLEKNQPALTWQEKREQLYKYITSWQAKRKGFVDFMYRNWLRGLKEDNKTHCTSRKEKRWAHRRGFYSYHIRQYHLTEENYREILSDYDYKRLRPLNCRYHKWLWDKQMSYFVLSPFGDYLPEYYYRVVPEKGKVTVIPYDPACDDGTLDDIIALVRRKGKLALKPTVGSHGEGFYKLSYADGDIYVNNERCTVDEVKQLLAGRKSTYIVSEYVEMHHELKQIYDKVACTIRVMTIQNGASSPVKNAYLRIGTSFTGNTDNLGSGGIAVPIDLETGHLEKAELLIDHEFTPCDIHPDTGAPVQGQIPYWEDIKGKITKICDYLRPLEYLGFDIVVTEDGFRILEINTHQDLHKYPDYPQEVKDYFTEKMARRKMK